MKLSEQQQQQITTLKDQLEQKVRVQRATACFTCAHTFTYMYSAYRVYMCVQSKEVLKEQELCSSLENGLRVSREQLDKKDQVSLGER